MELAVIYAKYLHNVSSCSRVSLLNGHMLRRSFRRSARSNAYVYYPITYTQMSEHSVSDFPDWTRELAGLHDQPLRRYAYSLCRDWELANDAVQNTWLRFFRSCRPDVEPKIPAWLFLVCRRQVIDFLRRKGRMIEQGNDFDAPADCPAPVTIAESEDTARVLFAQVDLLPPAQREVLRLKFQGGLSYAEIGEVTDRTANAVGVLIHTALRTLRERVRLNSDLVA